MKNLTKSVSITITLITLNAVFWFIYAVIMFFGDSRSTIMPNAVSWVFSILALGSSVILIGLAIFLKRRKRFAFYLGLPTLAIIAVLSVTDEFGLLDLFSLFISLTPLVLMLKDRDWYLKP